MNLQRASQIEMASGIALMFLRNRVMNPFLFVSSPEANLFPAALGSSWFGLHNSILPQQAQPLPCCIWLTPYTFSVL